MDNETPYLTLVVDWIAGWCPVQAEGTVNGVKFYFRARGSHWTMDIGEEPVSPKRKDNLFHREANWDCPDDGYGAGWMPLNTAMALIGRCACEYAAEQWDSYITPSQYWAQGRRAQRERMFMDALERDRGKYTPEDFEAKKAEVKTLLEDMSD